MGSVPASWLANVNVKPRSPSFSYQCWGPSGLSLPRIVVTWRAYKALCEPEPMRGMMGTQSSPVKSYDYLLKFLLVGDSDVGKGEILESLQDGSVESPYAYSSGE